jgi:hypothetical protein
MATPLSPQSFTDQSTIGVPSLNSDLYQPPQVINPATPEIIGKQLPTGGFNGNSFQNLEHRQRLDRFVDYLGTPEGQAAQQRVTDRVQEIGAEILDGRAPKPDRPLEGPIDVIHYAIQHPAHLPGSAVGGLADILEEAFPAGAEPGPRDAFLGLLRGAQWILHGAADAQEAATDLVVGLVAQGIQDPQGAGKQLQLILGAAAEFIQRPEVQQYLQNALKQVPQNVANFVGTALVSGLTDVLTFGIPDFVRGVSLIAKGDPTGWAYIGTGALAFAGAVAFWGTGGLGAPVFLALKSLGTAGLKGTLSTALVRSTVASAGGELAKNVTGQVTEKVVEHVSVKAVRETADVLADQVIERAVRQNPALFTEALQQLGKEEADNLIATALKDAGVGSIEDLTDEAIGAFVESIRNQGGELTDRLSQYLTENGLADVTDEVVRDNFISLIRADDDAKLRDFAEKSNIDLAEARRLREEILSVPDIDERAYFSAMKEQVIDSISDRFIRETKGDFIKGFDDHVSETIARSRLSTASQQVVRATALQVAEGSYESAARQVVTEGVGRHWKDVENAIRDEKSRRRRNGSDEQNASSTEEDLRLIRRAPLPPVRQGQSKSVEGDNPLVLTSSEDLSRRGIETGKDTFWEGMRDLGDARIAAERNREAVSPVVGSSNLVDQELAVARLNQQEIEQGQQLARDFARVQFERSLYGSASGSHSRHFQQPEAVARVTAPTVYAPTLQV